MPYLSQADRDAYANRRKCGKCMAEIRKEYCSRCDEFYTVGHTDKCPIGNDEPHDSTTCGGDRGYR